MLYIINLFCSLSRICFSFMTYVEYHELVLFHIANICILSGTYLALYLEFVLLYFWILLCPISPDYFALYLQLILSHIWIIICFISGIIPLCFLNKYFSISGYFCPIYWTYSDLYPDLICPISGLCYALYLDCVNFCFYLQLVLLDI